MPPTHYHLLGLPRSATPEQIKRAYRAQAKALHPDVNPSKDAAKRFAKLAAAYQVLSDPAAKKTYDRRLAAAEARTAPPTRAQQHYSWDNIAASPQPRRVDISEIDELYDTFFTKRPFPARPPTPSTPNRSPIKPRRTQAKS